VAVVKNIAFKQLQRLTVHSAEVKRARDEISKKSHCKSRKDREPHEVRK